MADRPNILLIMSDQHNPHVLGCAGDEVVRTPNLDRLAADGVHFTANYCPAPLCVPSRMAFLTGRYPSDNRVWTNHCVLNTLTPTFAHSLAAAGYETILCGRMHFRGADQRHGFTARHVGEAGGSIPGVSKIDLGHIPVSTTGQCREAVDVFGPGRTSYQVFDEHITEAARRLLLERKSGGAQKPFAMVVGFVLPHCPYICPKDLYAEYHGRVTIPEFPDGYFSRQHPAIQDWRRRRGILDVPEETTRGAKAAYYGLVTHMDALIGSILETLADAGLGDDTVVVYTSDHGEMVGEHGMWWKSNFYEGSAGVPLIVSAPGRFAAGASISKVTSLLDIAPTLIELAGAEPLPQARGHSLLPLLRGEDAADWPDVAFCEHYTSSRRSDPPCRMVRKGPWKLNCYYGYDTPELFNLEEDPEEMNDLVADPSLTARREELLGLVMDGWHPETIITHVERVVRDTQVVAAWGRSVKPPDPDHWIAPPGSNVFPQD